MQIYQLSSIVFGVSFQISYFVTLLVMSLLRYHIQLIASNRACFVAQMAFNFLDQLCRY